MGGPRAHIANQPNSRTLNQSCSIRSDLSISSDLGSRRRQKGGNKLSLPKTAQRIFIVSDPFRHVRAAVAGRRLRRTEYPTGSGSAFPSRTRESRSQVLGTD